jgi:CHASE2 domain-containing sensor protein
MHCGSRAWFGLLATLLLLFASWSIEQTAAGRALEVRAYLFLLMGVPDYTEIPLPQVFDINQLPGSERNPTSRKALQALVTAIAAKHPRAIAIDIDFSPSLDRSMTPDDGAFFEFCREKTLETGIPIFLGINRTREEKEPKRWLGYSKYSDLAAAGYARNQDPRLERWVPGHEKAHSLPTIGEALAETYRKTPLEPPKWIRWAIASTDQVLVNYSELHQLMSEAKPISRSSSLNEYTDQLQDRLILLGDVRNASDKVNVPGQRDPIPGVLVMASLAYTLAMAPFFEFTHAFRFLLDAAISLFLVVGLYLICRRKSSQGPKFLFIVVGVVLVAGFLLVWAAGIVWLDFVLILFALFLHPRVEKWFSEKWEKRQLSKTELDKTEASDEIPVE